MAYAFVSPKLGAGTGLTKANRDPLIDGDNGGVRALYDLGFGYSYPGGAKPRAAAAAPLNGQAVVDVAGRGNGKVNVQTAGQIAFAAGGLDFSGVVGPGIGVGGNLETADVGSDLASSIGGLTQRFMIAMYCKLPATADWNSAGGGVASMLSSASQQYGAGIPELLVIDQESTATPYTLAARRQTSGGTIDKMILSIQPTDRAILAQVAYWRNGAGQGFRVRTANGSQIATLAVGSDNDQSIAGLKVRAGVGYDLPPTQANNGGAMKWKLYRLFVENLARSLRDPLTVLDADWDRQQARIASSAAANGGTSQIYG